MEYEELTEKIIGCAFTVYNTFTATIKPVGLVLNFGPKRVEIKRKVRELPEKR